MLFSQKSGLIRHLHIHKNEKTFKYNIFNKSFSQKSHLTTHLRIHNNDKSFKCNICNKSFSRKYHLTTHLHMHNTEVPFWMYYWLIAWTSVVFRDTAGLTVIQYWHNSQFHPNNTDPHGIWCFAFWKKCADISAVASKEC